MDVHYPRLDGNYVFVHEWEPSPREDGIFRYPEIVQGVRDINAEVTSLAAVLNSPTVEGGAQVEAAVPVAQMVKEYGGSTYLFAVAMRDLPAQATFTVSRHPRRSSGGPGRSSIPAAERGPVSG